MSPSNKWLALLEPVKAELCQLAQRFREVSAPTFEYGREQRLRFALSWNDALERGLLNDPRMLLNKQQEHYRLEDSLRRGMLYRKMMLEFARSAREDPRLHASELYDQPDALVVERLYRGVGDLLTTIESKIPDEIRWQREGDLQIEWFETKGCLDGNYQWLGHEGTQSKHTLLFLGTLGMQRGAELPSAESQAFADLWLRQVRSGKMEFHRFKNAASDERQTILHWSNPMPEHGVSSLSGSLDVEQYCEPETDLWKQFPTVSAVVREGLLQCGAAEISEIAEAMQQLTGHSTEEMSLLLALLIEGDERLNPREGIARWIHAFTSFWTRLSLR